jgi:glycine hydroxymethyltransferase
VPFDPRLPMFISGLRVGTSALATRGLQADDFREFGDIIATALTPDYDPKRDELADRVSAIADRHPLYEQPGARVAA